MAYITSPNKKPLLTSWDKKEYGSRGTASSSWSFSDISLNILSARLFVCDIGKTSHVLTS